MFARIIALLCLSTLTYAQSVSTRQLNHAWSQSNPLAQITGNVGAVHTAVMANGRIRAVMQDRSIAVIDLDASGNRLAQRRLSLANIADNNLLLPIKSNGQTIGTAIVGEIDQDSPGGCRVLFMDALQNIQFDIRFALPAIAQDCHGRALTGGGLLITTDDRTQVHFVNAQGEVRHIDLVIPNDLANRQKRIESFGAGVLVLAYTNQSTDLSVIGYDFNGAQQWRKEFALTDPVDSVRASAEARGAIIAATVTRQPQNATMFWMIANNGDILVNPSPAIAGIAYDASFFATHTHLVALVPARDGVSLASAGIGGAWQLSDVPGSTALASDGASLWLAGQAPNCVFSAEPCQARLEQRSLSGQLLNVVPISEGYIAKAIAANSGQVLAISSQRVLNPLGSYVEGKLQVSIFEGTDEKARAPLMVEAGLCARDIHAESVVSFDGHLYTGAQGYSNYDLLAFDGRGSLKFRLANYYPLAANERGVWLGSLFTGTIKFVSHSGTSLAEYPLGASERLSRGHSAWLQDSSSWFSIQGNNTGRFIRLSESGELLQEVLVTNPQGEMVQASSSGEYYAAELPGNDAQQASVRGRYRADGSRVYSTIPMVMGLTQDRDLLVFSRSLSELSRLDASGNALWSRTLTVPGASNLDMRFDNRASAAERSLLFGPSNTGALTIARFNVETGQAIRQTQIALPDATFPPDLSNNLTSVDAHGDWAIATNRGVLRLRNDAPLEFNIPPAMANASAIHWTNADDELNMFYCGEIDLHPGLVKTATSAWLNNGFE